MSTPTKKQVANRELWVEALRSGEYKQGEGLLQEGPPGATRFCVWGVACDVIDPHQWSRFGPYVQHSRALSYPPQSVEDAMGMLMYENLWTDGRCVANPSLVVLNDSKEFSFDELADLIQLHTLDQLDQLDGGV